MTRTAPKIRTLLRLGRYIRPYSKATSFIVAGMIFESFYEVLSRYSFKLIVDQAVLVADFGMLATLLGLLGGASLLYASTTLVCEYFWTKFGLMALNDLRYHLFISLQNHPIQFFHGKRTGDLGARFTSDISMIEYGMLYTLPIGLSGLFQVILSLGLMAQMNNYLFLMGLAGVCLSLGAPKIINTKALAASYAMRNKEGLFTAHVQEHIAAQEVVKAYGLEEKSSADFRRELKALQQAGLLSNFLSVLTYRVPHLSMMLVNLVVFGFGATLVIQEVLSVGDLVAFQALFFGLITAMANVAWLTPSLIDAASGLQRIIDIIDTAPIKQEAIGMRELEPTKCSIRFEGVQFGHTQSAGAVLKVDFSIAQGEFVALVGPAGAGKTTIANLLLRFLEPDAGTIRLDGVDIQQGTVASLRRQIGLVPQNTILFRTTIRENIRAGWLDATDVEVEEAACAAGIQEFIMSLPQGYDTLLGQDGRQLSGGQAQRIAVARALLRKPEIMILDEATASLDSEAEAGILSSILNLKGHCTIIAITHRLVLARNADRILVLQSGSIVEDGHHEKLLTANGLYASLWRQRNIELA